MSARLLVVLAAASIALPAAAERRPPPPDGGRIDLGGGWRYVGSSSTAGAMGRFGWQIDGNWLLGIELGLTRTSLPHADGDVLLTLGDFRLVLAYQLALGPLYPYAAVGGGGHVVGLRTGDESYQERATAGLFAALGIYLPLGRRFGLILEDRYNFATVDGQVHGEETKLNLGGNMLWLGLAIVFDPEPAIGS